MPRIVIVCTANICRSPVGEAVLRQRLQAQAAADGQGERWQVSSAGTWADFGQAASTYSVELMAEQGLDISGHTSRPVDRAMMGEADLLLCMEIGHAEALRAEFPRQAYKIYLLTEMAGPAYSVSDPYGGSRGEYEHMVEELTGLIDAGLPRIISLARANERRRRG
jgi:protein-tyrosine-phosphatase